MTRLTWRWSRGACLDLITFIALLHSFTLVMATAVVLDCDWFVFGGRKYLKQLAYFVPSTLLSDTYSFTLPSQSHHCRCDLRKQAYHSHGLLWSQRGDFRDDQVPLAFCTIFTALLLRAVELTFYAKGLKSVIFWSSGYLKFLTWTKLDVLALNSCRN